MHDLEAHCLDAGDVARLIIVGDIAAGSHSSDDGAILRADRHAARHWEESSCGKHCK
jgi:hypothetical protein